MSEEDKNILKILVCEQNKRLPETGLVILTEGNVSQVSADRTFMVIKPSGVDYKDLSPDKMVVVDMQGNILEGDLRPSVDTHTHLEIYRKYPHIGGITHTHSSFATVFAQMHKSVPAYGTTHADAFGSEIPVTRALTDEEITGNLEINTGKVICEVLDQRHARCVLVASHGPFVFGKDARQSVDSAALAEQVAMMAILGQYRTPLQESLLKKHFERKHGKDKYYGQPEI